jgi:signal peptidase I
VVILILAVLFFRTFYAEAYFVPTGSMAPTIVGNHQLCQCPSCGYPIRVGIEIDQENEDAKGRARASAEKKLVPGGCCPNCGWDRLPLENVDEQPGDRLLVHKGIFALRSPRRWETIVFRNPHPGSGDGADAFIKRVVGLPGEAVQVRDGDIYINGHVARKRLADLHAMRLLVYDHDHRPRDAADPFRWTWDAASRWRSEPGTGRFRLPSSEAAEPYDWLRYRHLVRSTDDQERTTWNASAIQDRLGYNRAPRQYADIHDVIVQGTLVVKGNGWLALAVTDGYDDLLAEFPVGETKGKARATHSKASARLGGTNAPALLQPANVRNQPARIEAEFRLPTERKLEFEFGLVDRRLFLLLEDKPVFPDWDLPEPPLELVRQPLHGPLELGGWGPISIAGKGLELKVESLRLHRDIHYTDEQGSEQRHGIDRPVFLGDRDYYVLGDNSANSYDSRKWKGGPAVKQEHLIGKPFLVHLPAQIIQWEAFGKPSLLAVPDWKRIKMLR